jgi:hypothetical protein
MHADIEKFFADGQFVAGAAHDADAMLADRLNLEPDADARQATIDAYVRERPHLRVPTWGGQNPWSNAAWNVTAQGKLARQLGMAEAAKAAAAAGSYVGATKPPWASATNATVTDSSANPWQGEPTPQKIAARGEIIRARGTAYATQMAAKAGRTITGVKI